MLEISTLTGEYEHLYEEFLLTREDTLLYASVQYKKFLEQFLDCPATYFVAIDNGKIVGVLPSFEKNGPKGTVINSLPFYGSNGAITAAGDDRITKLALLKSLQRHVETINAAAVTVITSPFEKDVSFYEENFSMTTRDSRIGQITEMPGAVDDLMGIFHQKTRNCVRKGLKSNLKIFSDNSVDYLAFIENTHRDNLMKMGGLYKPHEFFSLVPNLFSVGKEFKIFIATLDDIPVAGLLTFYYNKTVEYFTPVTVEGYRELQPLSAVIYETMSDAIRSGYKYWNWGGTWVSQGGVYDFKKRWGTRDFPYYYYTKVYDDALLRSTKEELLTDYPYFFVVPFNALHPS